MTEIAMKFTVYLRAGFKGGGGTGQLPRGLHNQEASTKKQ